jgi:hypothetical protein
MLIVKNKRYVKKHVVGGAGIFDSITNFFKRMASSNAARSIASNLSKAAASDIGKNAISAAKTVGKELATSAISLAKDVAIAKGKQLINKKPKNTGLDPNELAATAPPITQKSKDILASLIKPTNINKLMMGQGSNAIRIEDFVKKMNGGGLRLA